MDSWLFSDNFIWQTCVSSSSVITPIFWCIFLELAAGRRMCSGRTLCFPAHYEVLLLIFFSLLLENPFLLPKETYKGVFKSAALLYCSRMVFWHFQKFCSSILLHCPVFSAFEAWFSASVVNSRKSLPPEIISAPCQNQLSASVAFSYIPAES